MVPFEKMENQMKLLTKDLRKKLPALYSQEDQEDPMVVAKFFTPDAGWTWFAYEFDGEDTFFGLVSGLEEELGYFSLAELTSIRGPFGLSIERDRHFQPKKLSQCRTR